MNNKKIIQITPALSLLLIVIIIFTQCKKDDHSPEYSFDTNIGFSIEVYNFEKSRYVQVFQTDNINKFKEPMGYFPDYDLIIDCNQVDSFHIQLILQKKNSIDVDTFNLSAQEKIIELYRNKI